MGWQEDELALRSNIAHKSNKQFELNKKYVQQCWQRLVEANDKLHSDLKLILTNINGNPALQSNVWGSTYLYLNRETYQIEFNYTGNDDTYHIYYDIEMNKLILRSRYEYVPKIEINDSRIEQILQGMIQGSFPSILDKKKNFLSRILGL